MSDCKAQLKLCNTSRHLFCCHVFPADLFPPTLSLSSRQSVKFKMSKTRQNFAESMHAEGGWLFVHLESKESIGNFLYCTFHEGWRVVGNVKVDVKVELQSRPTFNVTKALAHHPQRGEELFCAKPILLIPNLADNEDQLFDVEVSLSADS